MKGDLVVCDDGLQIRASLPGDGPPSIWFGSDNPISLPEASNGLAAARVGTSHVAMVRGHHDHAFRVTRTGVITNLGPVVGTYSVGVTPSGHLYWIKSPELWCINTSGNSFPVPRDAGGQLIYGQGWTQILAGEPRWTDLYGTHVIDGKTLTRCVSVGTFTVGMDTAAPRIVAYDHQDGAWWLVANTETQTGPQAVVGPAGILTAISGNPCFVVDQAQWTPLADPPVVIPTFPHTSHAIGLGLFDDPQGPARIIDVTEQVTPNVRAIFWQVGTSGQTKSRALAKSLNWGAEAYVDRYGITPADVPTGFRALVFAYPSENLSVDDSVALVDQALEALTEAQIPCDLAMAVYRQYNSVTGEYALGEQKVLDMMADVWKLAVAFKVGAIWGYTRRKPIDGPTVHDGLEKWPSFQTAWQRMKAASGDWQHFPPYAPPEPETWFPAARRFLMSETLDIAGLTLTVDWDYTIHRPIVKFLRNPPGDPVVYLDRDTPGPHEHMMLTRLPNGKVGARFIDSTHQLTVTPQRSIETRPADAPTQIMEEFDDCTLPQGGVQVLIHSSGLVFTVVR